MEAPSLEIDRDLEEAVRRMTSRAKDPAAVQRARDEADRIFVELKQKYGVRQLAVELIREIRDGE
jgi:hypothetical protein